MALHDDLAADLADIFSEDAEAVVTPAAGGTSWKLPGKLRSPYRPERVGMEVAGQGFRFLCRTVDKAALKRGDRLTIGGANYKHIEPQDGNPTDGMSTLQLAPL